MNVIRINHKHIPYNLDPCIACIGFFDGFHKGHQTLMQEALNLAKEKHCKASIITFDPDPWEVFHPDKRFPHITTISDRIELAESMGFDSFYILTFTKEFAHLSTNDFHDILHSLKVDTLICGFDFQYGSKNSGSVKTLNEQNLFQVRVIDSVEDSENKISSSRIEPLILEGDFKTVCRLLGFAYSIEGEIVHGYKRGSTILQIPTANLEMEREYLSPGKGVYAGLVMIDSCLHFAMINVGKNPTFENDVISLEAHILNFDQDIYDKRVRFCFLEKIRSEQKFNHILELKEQLLKDIETTRLICQKEDLIVKRTAQMWNKNICES